VNGLVEFLRARLNEDEATALAADGDSIEATPLYEGVGYLTLRGDHNDRYTGELPATLADHAARHDPARVLREVGAARQAIEHYERVAARSQQHPDYELATGAVEVQLKIRALPYADHPDYRAEWRAGEDPS
jgi:hypothetical protein